MKIKSDFITNSSSSSFIISKTNLTKKQIWLIHNHIEVGMIIANEQGRTEYESPWEITETKNEIKCSTSMDNFDLKWYLREIGIKDEDIQKHDLWR